MRWTLLLLGASLAAAQPPTAALSLEIRVFLGVEEVSGESRVTLHRAGEHTTALAPGEQGSGRHVFSVAPGIYDAQVVRERDGRVLNIRWAERLVVMPYPDEGGRHLEVVNFTNGYGALQIRPPRSGGLVDLAVFAAGERTRPAGNAAATTPGDDYALFVLPAGRYDVQVKTGSRPSWHEGIDVPLDRTRLWLIP
jgi:hypothetical protein